MTLPVPKKPEERKGDVQIISHDFLKPTQLEYKRPLGIESLMQSISLQEDTTKHPQHPRFVLYSIKLLLMLLRLFMDSNQVVACLYAGNFYALSHHTPASTTSLASLLRPFCILRLIWIVIESLGGAISLHLPPIPMLSDHLVLMDHLIEHGKTLLDIALLLLS